ncbi:DUF6221 family protein [Streptomyces chartreusis]|uniref:DUF6221 family protein n=1 Tax=Streptomyces chartreusis TaxID=1969 RepID=UPI00123D3567|nr:DUF6221 family protein [Streptomyces chartreusis]QEV66183.1 hypothetical protein CP983_05585 [Streptomyces chartreusis]GGW98490.1 hypothetical protein GCM10010321_11030 [Streptomyces chartreusis]
MDDLVGWLGEQLDEDERIAKEAGARSLQWKLTTPLDDAELGDAHWLRPDELKHVDRHDPARVLREIDAKRKLIARGGPFCTSSCDDPDNEPKNPGTNWTTPLEHHLDCAAYEAAKVLALPYADRPGYREAWRP